MIDRLVHHAEILSLKGDSFRLRGKDFAPARRSGRAEEEGVHFRPLEGGEFSGSPASLVVTASL